MELAIRINVRYVAPPNSYIRDMLQLFRSSNWVQFIIRYITPQLQNTAPISSKLIRELQETSNNNTNNNNNSKLIDEMCVICMEYLKSTDNNENEINQNNHCCNNNINTCTCKNEKEKTLTINDDKCIELPCKHSFHLKCILGWFQNHSTCPVCRYQLPTDIGSVFSVRSINTTIILQQSQANIPTEELLNMSSSNQTIRAVVNARVRCDVMNSNVSTNTLNATTTTTTSSSTATSTTNADANTITRSNSTTIPSSESISSSNNNDNNVQVITSPQVIIPNIEQHQHNTSSSTNQTTISQSSEGLNNFTVGSNHIRRRNNKRKANDNINYDSPISSRTRSQKRNKANIISSTTNYEMKPTF